MAIICYSSTDIKDDEQINNLDNIIFQRHRSLASFCYIYKDSERIILLSTDDGKIKGSGLLMPLKLQYLNQKIIIEVLCDYFILPELRRKGYGKIIINKAISIARSHNAISCGFLNHRHYKKDTLIKINTYAKHLSWLSDIKLKYKNKRHQTICHQLTSFNEIKDDDFFKLKEPRSNIKFTKNKNYLNWRYINFPDHDYLAYAVYKNSGIIGYFILEKKNKKCYIADMAYTNGYFDDLMTALYAQCHQLKFNKIIFVLLNKKLEQKIKALGFKIKKSDQYITIDNNQLSKDIYQSDSWHIIYGDLL